MHEGLRGCHFGIVRSGPLALVVGQGRGFWGSWVKTCSYHNMLVPTLATSGHEGFDCKCPASQWIDMVRKN